MAPAWRRRPLRVGQYSAKSPLPRRHSPFDAGGFGPEDPEALHLLDDYQATLATVLPTALESGAERLAYEVTGGVYRGLRESV